MHKLDVDSDDSVKQNSNEYYSEPLFTAVAATVGSILGVALMGTAAWCLYNHYKNSYQLTPNDVEDSVL